MICYEVSINGEIKYTAGIEDPDMFEARVDKLPGDESFVLSVTAALPSQGGRSVSWGAQELYSGDELKIRLVESEEPDEARHEGGFDGYVEENCDGSGEILACSFCGKIQNETGKLIAGPDVYICDECVNLCAEIVNEDP